MHPTTTALRQIFEQIPRRHSADNVKAIYALVDEYESLLQSIEAISPDYEKQVAIFFEDLDTVRASVKKSTDNKASKKSKDDYFADASSSFKTSIESVIEVFGDGEIR